MKRLRSEIDNLVLYNAGYPNFPRNFTRDSIISALLIRDPVMLKNQLLFCASKQGKKKNPFDGEEIGKIHHEYPGIVIDASSKVYNPGLCTQYNSCDGAALFLIGHEAYQNLTEDYEFSKYQRKSIDNATEYILRHINNGLFVDGPGYCDTDKFALKVTYWKDSTMIDRERGEPSYPVVYPFAHIQNTRAIKSAARLLKSKNLKKISDNMVKAIRRLWDTELGLFYLAVDQKGPIRGISSDSLHSLFYLDKEDIPAIWTKSMCKSSKVLETKVGYLTLDPLLAKESYEYHTKTVWPFEQAMINIGARKFRLDNTVDISSRIMNCLDSDPELVTVYNDSIQKKGCDPQLWTIAAKKYFENPWTNYLV